VYDQLWPLLRRVWQGALEDLLKKLRAVYDKGGAKAAYKVRPTNSPHSPPRHPDHRLKCCPEVVS
jgi:hypothetical protein